MLTLLACAESDPAYVPAPLDPDVADVLLAAEPTEVAPLLATVPWDAPAPRLDPEGPRFGRAEAGGAGTVAVVDVRDDARVVLRWRGVRLLAWMDDDGLQPVVAESTWVDADGRRVRDDEAGIRVPAGRAVHDGEVRLSTGEDTLPVRVAPGLVDSVWTPDDGREARALSERLKRWEDSVWLLGGTALRDEGGRVLARLRASACYVAIGLVLAEDGDERLVLVDLAGWGGEGPVFVRGWVDAPPEPGLDGACYSGVGGSSSILCGGSSALSGSDTLALPAGALLYDAPDGDVVGVTERSVRLGRADDAGAMPGWAPVLAPSRWGDDLVWTRVDGDEVVEPDLLDGDGEIGVREVDRVAAFGG